jgi:hypothetical protein
LAEFCLVLPAIITFFNTLLGMGTIQWIGMT